MMNAKIVAQHDPGAVRRRRHRLAGGVAAALLLECLAVSGVRAHTAAEHARSTEEVVVIGHYDNAVGTSDAASQGTITSKLLKTRPASRPGEILEFVPGLIVTQHSGDGKANQYFLRGFNLDHGTDFSTFIDGMPVNLPTHAHGHGYTDLNLLIPELIDRVDYRKGPYFAGGGDFSSVGSAQIAFKRSLKEPFAQFTLGRNGYQRLLAAGSSSPNPGARLLGALELQAADGPWENPQNLRRVNALLRYSEGSRANGFDVSLMMYRSDWRSTDQVPQRAIDAGLIGRFGTVDPSTGGQTARYSLSGQWRRALADGALNASAYAIAYRLDLFSNFTYALENPVDGDQFLQRDRRSVYGGTLSRLWVGQLGGLTMTNELGVQARHDRIRVGLFDTVERTVSRTTRDDRVRQTSVALYGENSVNWTPWLRTVAGLRAEQFDWRVASSLQANGGTESAALLLPKFSAVFGPWAKTEYFANWGRGFHSNDARGTVIRVDPRTGDPVQPVTGLVRTTGYEVGVRSEWLPKLQSSLALWRLDLGSELLFVGDAGTTEASRPSTRHGVEWSNRYVPLPWLLFDLDLAWSRARFTDDDPAGPRVPGSVGRVASAAVAIRDLGPWSASLQLRYLGPRPLIEDGSAQASSTSLLNTRVGYRISKGTELSFDVFNLLNRRVNDIAYFYSSRLRSEPAPVDDYHVHPAEPRTLRVSLRMSL